MTDESTKSDLPLVKKSLKESFKEQIQFKKQEKRALRKSLEENLIFESNPPILSSVLIEKRLRFALKWKQWKPRNIKISHQGSL